MSEPTDNELLVTLRRIEERLERLESSVASLTEAKDQVPALVATAADSFDGAVDQLTARGVDVDERLRQLVELLERLTRPETLGAVREGAAIADAAPGMVAAAVDTVDSLVQGMAERGIDVDERLRTILDVAERLTSPEALSAVCKAVSHVEVFHRLLDSDLLDETAVAIASGAGSALANAGTVPVLPLGPFGAFLALSEPDVKRAMGFAIEFGRNFGRTLEELTPKAGGANGASSTKRA